MRWTDTTEFITYKSNPNDNDSISGTVDMKAYLQWLNACCSALLRALAAAAIMPASMGLIAARGELTPRHIDAAWQWPSALRVRLAGAP